MRARLNGQDDRHRDDTVRDPSVDAAPPARDTPGHGRRDIVARLWRAIVDLEPEPQRAVVPEAIERGRDVRGDSHVPAALVSVEQVEVVFATSVTAIGTLVTYTSVIGSKGHAHAGTAACSEVEIVPASRPRCHTRDCASQARYLNPGDALYGRVPGCVDCFNGHRPVALDEAFIENEGVS